MKRALFFISFFFFCLVNAIAENPPVNPLPVNAGDDLIICAPGQTVTLNGSVGGPFSSVSWDPPFGMSDPNSLNPDVFVSGTTTFTLTANGQGATTNLIFNGDFEAGSVGFSSSYIPGTGGPFGLLSNEGEYAISTNPALTHTNFANCPGSNMMVVNGSTTPGAPIWCQTVTVDPNTTYEFSAWLTSVNPSNPAILQFSVNGILLGNPFNLSSALCNWTNFFETWNSGGSTSAEICITNQNTAGSGNDFAIDDITFGPVCSGTDQVTVTVVEALAIANPFESIPCNNGGAGITLNGTGSSAGPGVTYQWTTFNGTILSGANTLTPLVGTPGTYELTVSVSTSFGPCTSTALVEVIADLPPDAFATTGNDINCSSTTGTVIGSGSTVGPNITYLWSTPDGFIISGETDIIAEVGAGGTYTLLVTDESTGCTAEASTIVTADLTLPTAEAEPDGDLDCNNTSVTIDGSGSSGGPNLSYDWSTTNGNITSGTTGESIEVDAAGTYQLVVTNEDNGCTATVLALVNSDQTPPVINIATPGQLTCLVANFTLDASGSTGTGNLAFAWTTTDGNIVSGSQTSMPEINQTGTYTLMLTDDANGCTAEDSILVEGNVTPPDIVIETPEELTCTTNEITLDASGSQAGVSFSWATTDGNIVSGENTPQPVVDQNGTYILTITDPDNGCTNTGEVAVTSDQSLPVADAGEVIQLDCNTISVLLNGTGSSAGPEFSYLWTTTDGDILNGETTLEPEIGSGGTYTLTVTNNLSGCTNEDNVIIPQNNDLPTAVATVNDELNCLNDSLTLDGTGSSFGAGFTIEWSTADGNIASGASTLAPVVDQPGTYTLIVTNLNSNCTATQVVEVAENLDTPQADPGVTATLTCTNDTLQLNGSNSILGNNDLVLWSSPDGAFAAGENTLTPTVTEPGTYTLTITNPNSGCTDQAMVTIDENTVIPTADAGAPMELTCTVTSLALDGEGSSQNGNFSYLWTTTNGNITSGEDSLMPVVDAAGTYLLTVFDNDNGCENTSLVEVTLNGDFPNAEAGNTAVLTCATTEITLNGSGDTGSAFTYAWATPDGNILANENTLTPVIGAPGTYTLTVTNQDNGCTASDEVIVSENTTPPVADAGPTNELSCTQTELSLNGTGNAPGNNIAFAWTTTNGNLLSGSNSPSPVVNAAGTYWLVVTDLENGCVDSASVQITQDANVPIADAGTAATLTCNVTTLQLDGSGSTANPNILYQWTTTNGNITAGETTLTPIVDAPGTYLLTVTDLLNDCEAVSSVLISENTTPPAANAGPEGLLTCNDTQLTLDGSASANGPAFTYQWTTANGNILSGETTLNPEINAPGNYEVLVTNQTTGCTNTATVAVTENTTPPTVLIAAPGLLTCATTTLQLDASNSSSGPFSYLWTTADGSITAGETTTNPTVGSVGAYELLITNNLNGCTATGSVFVGEDTAAPTANAGQPVGLDCNQPSAMLDGSGSSTGSDLQYSWNTVNGNIVSGEQTLSPLVDAAGTYTLTVLNEINGCVATAEVEVTLDTDPPVVSILPPATLTCTVEEITLDAGNSSAGSNFQYEWISQNGNIVSGQSTLLVTVNEPGNYELIILNNENGCQSDGSVTVTEEIDLPAVDAGPSFELHCNLQEINLTGSTNLAAGQFTAIWQTTDGHIAANGQTLTPLIDEPGVYQLQILNTLTGCANEDEVVVTENILQDFVFQQQSPGCLSPVGGLSFTDVLGGTPPYSYSIDDGQFFSTQTIYQNLSSGLYDLVVSDANGCTLTDVAFLSDPPEVQVFLEAQAVIQLGEGYQLNALTSLAPDEIGQVEWTPTDDLSCTDCLNPVATPLQQTSYQIKVTSKDGCTAAATTSLFVRKNLDIYVPNAFSPNGDGINDRFLIYAGGNGISQINNFKVFSRWGETIYQMFTFPPNDPMYGWDGTHRGEIMNPAVFVWLAEVELIDGTKRLLEGEVTLVR